MSVHHIVLVSEQLAPAWIPAVLPGQEVESIQAIVTPAMLSRSAILQKAWEARGGKYRVWPLAGIEQWQIHEVLEAIRSAYPGAELVLNITGGTKLMAIAAYEWAYSSDVPGVYADTETLRLVWLKSGSWVNEPMPALLDVQTLLALNDYALEDLRRAETPALMRTAHQGILALLQTAEGVAAVGALNEHAVTADQKLVSDRTKFFPQFNRLLEICSRAGKLMFDNRRIIFSGDPERRWCNGLWLEEYVASVLWQLAAEKRIQSWATSVHAVRDEVVNELDALFTSGNRLFTIECKTGRMDAKGPVTAMLYKADSLQGRLGGIFAKSMICSVKPLSADGMRRAEKHEVRVITGGALKNLKKHLVKWSENESAARR